jgi:hypothetical protein
LSGTSLVILAMYSTVNVVSPHGAVTPQSFPYVLALLMAAVALACAGTLALYQTPSRTGARGATLPKARRLVGPRDRRL